jgi:hypothetical protein
MGNTPPALLGATPMSVDILEPQVLPGIANETTCGDYEQQCEP